MKLKTLTIENLASIAEATIDFEASPLGDASVFLISGDTGSGKSTILDAICLALYNTVPRMEAASVGRNDSQAANNESRSAHVFQLLRKGTAHTLVTLRFTGLYDKEYEAHWGIRRARNKPDGKLRESQMDLTLAELTLDTQGNETGREEIKRNRSNCARVTESVIGLTYAQFCRTTMLAQGEFTRFIKSDGAEKSAILAKVTDRGDFYGIGRAIHEITSEKKRELDDLRRDMAGVKILSDVETDALKAEIKEADSRLAGLDAEAMTVVRKREWLAKAADLDARVRKNHETVKALQTRVDDDTFTTVELRAKQWFETELVRRDRIRLRATRSGIADAEKILRDLRGQYCEILSARETVAADLDKACREEEELKKQIATFAPKQSLMNQEAIVLKRLSVIISRQNDIKDAERRNTLRDAEIRKATSLCETESVRADGLKESYEKAVATTVEVRGRLTAIGLPDVTRQISALGERKTVLTSFIGELERYGADVRTADQLEAEIKSERARFEADTKICDGLDKTLDKAAREMETARVAYETARLTVDDFTQRLRESLSVGCECPVCRQKVTEPVTFDMTEGLEYVRTLRQKASQARENHDAVVREIAEARGVLKKTLGEIERKEKCLGETRSGLEKRLRRLTGQASDLTAVTEERQPAAWEELARSEILKIEKALAELRMKSDEGKTVERELDKSLQTEKKALEAWQAQEKRRSDAANALAALETARKVDTETTARCMDEIEKTHSILAEMIDTTVWGYDSPVKATAFEKSFAEECGVMRGLDNSLEMQSRVVQQLRDCVSDIDAECAHIRKACPEFSSVVPSSSERTAAVTPAYARKVAGEVDRTVADLSRLEIQEKELTSGLNGFLDIHPVYDDTIFDSLDRLTQTEAQQIRDECDGVRTELKSARQIQLQLDAEHEILYDTRPEISEEDNAEKLRGEADRIKDEQARVNRQKGAASQQLANDAVNREKCAGMKRKADMLQADFDRWSAFNDRLGSANGEKFNRIAQSYVLADLLDRANVYLGRMMDRYRLVGQPGSYDIHIVDRLQGDAVRSVHSTSGGEGFLVSLSLALALGDIGNRLTVEPLFIDEGFGSLSGEPLQHAIDLLNSLRRQLGRRVGVISHIPALRESIPVQLNMRKDPDSDATVIDLRHF